MSRFSGRTDAISPLGPRSLLTIVAIAAVVAVSLGSAPLPVDAAAPPLYRVERTLSLPVAGDVELALSGTMLLWQEGEAAGIGRLAGVDLRTNRRLPLPTPTGSQSQPALAGSIAAWIEIDPATERPRLVAYDLESQHRTDITGPAALPDHPAVDG